jgi:hypothetical protein
VKGKGMDVLTFWSLIVNSLAWPIASILMVLIFKEPFIDLIKNIESLSYKGAVAKFGKTTEHLAIEIDKEFPIQEPLEIQVADQIQIREATAAAAEPAERLEASSSETLPRDAFDEIYFKLEESPSLAITLAWTKLEIEAMLALKRHKYFEEKKEIVINSYNILNGLREKNLLDKKQLQIFNGLRKLRNNAIHRIRLPIPEGIALGYIEAAKKMYKYFKDI